MRTSLVIGLALCATAGSALAQVTLVPRGSIWQYYVSGPAATNWAQPGFDSRTWPSAQAQLGFGDGDEQTRLFDDWGDAPATIYFRRAFTVTNLPALFSVTLRLLADDGAVVYLNGMEVARRNLPSGPVGFFTAAVANLETNENSFAQFGFFPFQLRPGTNTLAVEVHQHPAGREDCSFDLELLANLPLERPSAVIVNPADGAVLSASPVSLEIAASSVAGNIRRVEWYTNGALLGQPAVEPFSLFWQPPAPGRYRINARVIDSFSALNDAPPVRVQVGDSGPPGLLTGPYLQCGSPTGMVVRWQTDWFSDTVVRYGTNVNHLDRAATNAVASLDHEMNLTGLHADTTYWYASGSTAGTLAGGSDFHFRTSPTNARPVRVWVIGDSGLANQDARDVRDAYAAVTGAEHTDVWLMLGDNSYSEGFDESYRRDVFDMYPELLRRTVLWPTLGNHDAGDDPRVFGTGGAGYLRAFTLPRQGEAGGVASGSELYYSFDYANAHFICLDSYVSDHSTNGPMLTWLADDLAATDKDWIIAYWHHPPYSRGGHDSDTDPWQTEMRERALPLLEAYGADLVLAGHSHVYERSFLLDGHYGYSRQLQPSMVLDARLGRLNEGGPYRKPAGGLGEHRGTVYTVCGCSGQGGEGAFESTHPVMAVSHGGFGSMILEINGLQLRARFLRPSLSVDDEFTIDKSAPAAMGPRLQITRGTNGTLISWPTANPAFALERAETLPAPHWDATSELVRTNGRRSTVTLGTNGGNRYFRLRSQP
jgi:hypothetical protein